MKIKTVHIAVVVLVVIAIIFANEAFYVSPYLTVSQITETTEHVGKKVKVLGKVADASAGWSEEGLDFLLTDEEATVAVTYTGSLSQSLKKGQEVGVIGVQDSHAHVTAKQLEIKCASKYE